MICKKISENSNIVTCNYSLFYGVFVLFCFSLPAAKSVAWPDVFLGTKIAAVDTGDVPGTAMSLGGIAEVPIFSNARNIRIQGTADFWTQSYRELGTVSGATGNGKWFLRGSERDSETQGDIFMDREGNYKMTIPLLCGEQLLSLFWENSNGVTGLTYEINRTNCRANGLRLTLSWGENANDLELHLIRSGGRINNQDSGISDCTWTNMNPDWGPSGDDGNPKKDVDWTGDKGIENIFLEEPENTTYDVYVEYWATGEAIAASLTVNLGGETKTYTSSSFTPKQVWYLGRIDWSKKTIDVKDEMIDCSTNWDRGCLMQLP